MSFSHSDPEVDELLSWWIQLRVGIPYCSVSSVFSSDCHKQKYWLVKKSPIVPVMFWMSPSGLLWFHTVFPDWRPRTALAFPHHWPSASQKQNCFSLISISILSWLTHSLKKTIILLVDLRDFFQIKGQGDRKKALKINWSFSELFF